MNANTNSDKLAARSTPPPKSKTAHESGEHAIDARIIHLVMADPCLLWSEAAAILGVDAANIEQENSDS